MSKPSTQVAVVMDRGGAVRFVGVGESDKLIADGLARAATAQDLAIAGVTGARPLPAPAASPETAPAPAAPAPVQE